MLLTTYEAVIPLQEAENEGACESTQHTASHLEGTQEMLVLFFFFKKKYQKALPDIKSNVLLIGPYFVPLLESP